MVKKKEEGFIDPYADGPAIKNPEPDNNRGRGVPKVAATPSTPAPGLKVPHKTPNEKVVNIVIPRGRKGR